MSRRTSFSVLLLLIASVLLCAEVFPAVSTNFIAENDPLIKAIDQDKVDVLWAWLKKNNSPQAVIRNRMKEQLFDRAASHGSVRSCTLLLKAFRHYQLNQKLVDYRGTPVLVSVASLALPGAPKEKQYIKIIQNTLKIFPESIHDQDKAYVGDGRTALHEAAANGSVELIKILLSSGAKINAVNSTGETPLHFASRFGHVGAARTLLLYRANPNVQAAHTLSTPLMLASEKGFTNIVNVLLAYDARRDLRDAFGKTATDRYREHLDKLVATGFKKKTFLK